MNAIQVTSPLRPQAYLKAAHHVQGLRPLPPVLVSYGRGPVRYPSSIKLTNGRQKCHHLITVCSSRGEASSGNGSKDPLWKSFGEALENFGKKSSVEDELRQRTEEGEFYDEGGSGGNPPWGRGGGGGGGGSDGSEDEGFSGELDETIQVVLATLGLIFVYVYIINGAELTLLVKDYIRFLVKGKKSVRLTRFLDQWEAFLKSLTAKEVDVDKFWLEKAIINTPTWWDHPEKYRHLMNALSDPENYRHVMHGLSDDPEEYKHLMNALPQEKTELRIQESEPSDYE